MGGHVNCMPQHRRFDPRPVHPANPCLVWPLGPANIARVGEGTPRGTKSRNATCTGRGQKLSKKFAQHSSKTYIITFTQLAEWVRWLHGLTVNQLFLVRTPGTPGTRSITESIASGMVENGFPSLFSGLGVQFTPSYDIFTFWLD